MRRAAPRRRRVPIVDAPAVALRLLWHRLRVAGDADTLDLLLPLLPQAEHPMAPRRAMRYDVRALGPDRIEVREDGEVLVIASSPQAASDAVYVRAHRRAFELASLAGWARVHAAAVDFDGTRVLIVGDSGAGKTTLALRMLFDGAAVQGDESALVRAGSGSIAVPRAFHVKDGTDAVVPELRDLGHLPRVEDVRVLDPARVRGSWALAVAPIDHVVLLERGGGEPSVGAATNAEVLEALLRQTFPITETKADLVRTLVGALARAQGHHLTAGDPEATVGALHRILG